MFPLQCCSLTSFQQPADFPTERLLDIHQPIILSHLRLNIIFHYKAKNCQNLFSQVVSKSTQELPTAFGSRGTEQGAERRIPRRWLCGARRTREALEHGFPFPDFPSL